MKELERFYFEQDEPIKGCLLALRSIISGYNSEFEEKWYYRLPCFMYQKEIFCYLWIDRKTQFPYIAIGKGVKIDHPALIHGNRKFTSLLMIDPSNDIDIKTIHAVFDMVMELYPEK